MTRYPVLTAVLGERDAELLAFIAQVEQRTLTTTAINTKSTAKPAEGIATDAIGEATTDEDCRRLCRSSTTLRALAHTVRPWLDNDEWPAATHALFELAWETAHHKLTAREAAAEPVAVIA
jgi:hypothetical protein